MYASMGPSTVTHDAVDVLHAQLLCSAAKAEHEGTWHLCIVVTKRLFYQNVTAILQMVAGHVSPDWDAVNTCLSKPSVSALNA